MPALTPVRRAVRLGLTAAGALAFLAPLLTRLVIGQAFFFTGRGKIENFANTVSFFTDLGIPLPELNAAFKQLDKDFPSAPPSVQRLSVAERARAGCR